MSKAYCNKHYGFYEVTEGCTYCPPRPPPSSMQAFRAKNLNELSDVTRHLAQTGHKRVFFNDNTWACFLNGPGYEQIRINDWNGAPDAPVGHVLGVDFFLCSELQDNEIHVEVLP